MQTCIVIGEEFVELYFDGHFVVGVNGLQSDEIIGAEFLELQQYGLYLYGEYVYTLEDYHVVAAAFHAVETGMVASAGTFAGKDAGEVACAVSQQGHCFAVDCCEHKFANFAFGYRFEGFGVYNFNNIIVLPNVETVLLGTFECYAGTAHFGHSE